MLRICWFYWGLKNVENTFLWRDCETGWNQRIKDWGSNPVVLLQFQFIASAPTCKIRNSWCLSPHPSINSRSLFLPPKASTLHSKLHPHASICVLHAPRGQHLHKRQGGLRQRRAAGVRHHAHGQHQHLLHLSPRQDSVCECAELNPVNEFHFRFITLKRAVEATRASYLISSR